jgi:hypothetical protein
VAPIHPKHVWREALSGLDAADSAGVDSISRSRRPADPADDAARGLPEGVPGGRGDGSAGDPECRSGRLQVGVVSGASA